LSRRQVHNHQVRAAKLAIERRSPLRCYKEQVRGYCRHQLRTATTPIGFQRIDVRDIVFRYVDKLSDTIFQIGPIDFTRSRGDLVFVTGGNGSGKKSTFLRVLAGLYAPDSGEITLDGARIYNEARDQYRALKFPRLRRCVKQARASQQNLGYPGRV